MGSETGQYPMEPGFYNMDCVEAMKRFPNGFFDLAIVDPPYGDGNSDVGGVRGSADGSTDTKRWNRFGNRFDRYKKLEPLQGVELPKIQRGGYTPAGS